jgi:hypothetical protein
MDGRAVAWCGITRRDESRWAPAVWACATVVEAGLCAARGALFAGLLKFQGQFSHHATKGRYREPFLAELVGGLGQSCLELVAFCGDLSDAVGDERLGAYSGAVVIDEFSVVSIDGVAAQVGFDDW